MVIKKFIFATAIMVSAGASYAWNLVYAHDANGTPTAGSLQTLRGALKNGSSVKVHIVDSSAAWNHSWSINCTQVSIKTDATQAVVCIGEMGLGIDLRVGSTFGAVSGQPISVHYAANTLGQYAESHVVRSNGSLQSRNLNNATMQWFVN